MQRAIAFLLAAGCVPLAALAGDAVTAVYSGEYFYNFESANFTPDGTKECWVVSGGIKPAELQSPDGSPP